MITSLKYYLTPLLSLFGVLGLFLGGIYMWSGLLIMAVVVIGGDFVFGSSSKKIESPNPFYLNLPLYLALPLLTFYLFVLAWSAGSGTDDFLFLGKIFSTLFSYDVFTARDSNNSFHYFGALLSAGFSVAGYGTNAAHELTHRIHKKWDWIVGRWLLSMSLNADFAIEHVWGHHVRIGTEDDPATAKEGENVYSFVVRSAYHSFFSAWNIEKKRLIKKGLGVWSFHNKFLRGQLMGLCWPVLFYMVAGPLGVALFVGQALFAKFILEVVNYLEHYGLHREKTERVAPHHSWNSNKRMSGLVLFSLNRHSAHHEKGMTPFWELDPYTDTPHLPFGYLGMIVVSLVPPLWFKLMDPEVAAWKKQYLKA